MTPRVRITLFFVAAAVLFPLLLWGMHGLPEFGHYPGPYGDVLNTVSIPERNLTNVVSAVNFDYRAVDTLGEEFILFAAVTGLTLLLREMRGEKKARTEQKHKEPPELQRRDKPAGDAERWLGLVLIGLCVVFGVYIIIHAHLTPGGGFQGGAILGTAALMVYLVTGFEAFEKVTPDTMLELADAGGAGTYAVVGFATLMLSGVFLLNSMPKGQTGQLLSGGFVLLINIGVGLEVAGGFVLVFKEFITQAETPEADEPPPEEERPEDGKTRRRPLPSSCSQVSSL